MNYFKFLLVKILECRSFSFLCTNTMQRYLLLNVRTPLSNREIQMLELI